MKPERAQRRSGLHVLFIAAEADPLIKMGGLGDVAGSLPPALKHADPDLDIRVVIPHYKSLNKDYPARFLSSYTIPSTDGPVNVDVSYTEVNGLTVYLLGGDPIHAGEPVYPRDNAILTERFAFFSLACLALPDHLDWHVDILHANDWHTAIALHVLREKDRPYKSLKKTHSVLTVHNLPFMGSGSEASLERFLVKPAQNPAMPVWSRTIPLPMGLNAADRIVPVSVGYAKEILTPAYGCDLQIFLATREKDIHGIVNGIDYACWDPQKDTGIKFNYSVDSLEVRKKNKRAIQKEFQFPKDDAVPLFAVIGRLDKQKGLDIIFESFEQLGDTDWQLIVLAFGNDDTLRQGFKSLQQKFPARVRFTEAMNLPLSRRLYSAADMLLMPSRYEPCGLAQMIAMRYGCVPIATATGGLKDTIKDYSSDPAAATGFLANTPEVPQFMEQICLGIATYKNFAAWNTIQKNGMKSDFSWDKPAREYLALYNDLMQ
jgi:starch synthase